MDVCHENEKYAVNMFLNWKRNKKQKNKLKNFAQPILPETLLSTNWVTSQFVKKFIKL